MSLRDICVLALLPFVMGFQPAPASQSTQAAATSRIANLAHLDASSTIRQIGLMLGLKAGNRPRQWSPYGDEYFVSWPAQDKNGAVASASFNYKSDPSAPFPYEYISITLNDHPCITIDDLRKATGAVVQYMHAPMGGVDVYANIFDGLTIMDDGTRQIYLDQFKFHPHSDMCVAQFNVEAEPTILFRDDPNETLNLN